MSGHIDKRVRITKSGREGFLEIDQESLERVLIHTAPQDKPIAIIAVAGSMRTGKSFIQNFLIRYLRNRGWENKNWFGGGAKMADDGMKWAGGCERDTTGIIIWNEPFLVPNSRGEEVAVFIMDTQGLWDTRTIKANNVKLFTLSAIISSVQVLNVMRQIEERDLENLQLCVEYATAAAQQKEPQFSLQKLVFLVRDWQFGKKNAEEYLAHVLNTDAGLEELSRTRSQIRSSFQKLGCFLMPSPGDKVSDSERFTGKNEEIGERFKEELPRFVRELLHPSNLVQKMSNGKCVTPRELFNIILACDTVFVKGGLPPVETMMEAMAKAHWESALQNALKKYIDEMKKVLMNGDTYLAENLLRDAHVAALEDTKKCYDDTAKLGSPTVRDDYRKNLIQKCVDWFSSLKEKNLEKMKILKLAIGEIKRSSLEQYQESMRQGVRDGAMEDADFHQMHVGHFIQAINDFAKATMSEKFEQIRPEHQRELNERMEKFFNAEEIENQRRWKHEITNCQNVDKAKADNMRLQIVQNHASFMRKKLDENSVTQEKLTSLHEDIAENLYALYDEQLKSLKYVDYDSEKNAWNAGFSENYESIRKENEGKMQKEHELREDALAMEKLKRNVEDKFFRKFEKKLEAGNFSEDELTRVRESCVEQYVSFFIKKAKHNVTYSDTHIEDLRARLSKILKGVEESYKRRIASEEREKEVTENEKKYKEMERTRRIYHQEMMQEIKDKVLTEDALIKVLKDLKQRHVENFKKEVKCAEDDITDLVTKLSEDDDDVKDTIEKNKTTIDKAARAYIDAKVLEATNRIESILIDKYLSEQWLEDEKNKVLADIETGLPSDVPDSLMKNYKSQLQDSINIAWKKISKINRENKEKRLMVETQRPMVETQRAMVETQRPRRQSSSQPREQTSHTRTLFTAGLVSSGGNPLIALLGGATGFLFDVMDK